MYFTFNEYYSPLKQKNMSTNDGFPNTRPERFAVAGKTANGSNRMGVGVEATSQNGPMKQVKNSGGGRRWRANEAGTLLACLLEALKPQSKTSVKALLRHGQVWVNGAMVTHAHFPLHPGDEVDIIAHTGGQTAFRHPQMKIVWEDDDLIVVDKKDGLLSVPDSPAQQRTAYGLLSQYVRRIHPRNRIFILHRLDKGTSGLMMFARNKNVQEYLRANWHEMITRRTYIAVTEGAPEAYEGVITTYLAENSRMKVYCTDARHGKEAISRYRVLKSNAQYALVALELETGRKNQIRAQMEHLGCPVAGDPKYGAQTDPAGRLMLHATRLFFIHPATGEEMRFETPIPKRFRDLVKKTAAALTLFLAMFLACCTPATHYYEESGSVFHTLYRIKYQSPVRLTAPIDAELQAFNLSLNPFNPNSILSKVNRNEDVDVDDRFITVFNKAREVSENSGGMFDATVAPLINLWGFGFEKSDSITPAKIDSLKAFVGYRKIRLQGRKVIKDDPRILLNFSAIAKGYASDRIAATLEREGVANYMVYIGGEITVKGKNPHGNCWQIGIEKPKDDSAGITNDLEDTLRLCNNGALATSGNYRNYYIKDGKKYAHTINPHTGYPSEQTLLSATIIAPDCMSADAYATAFMAMGAASATRMAAGIPSIEYYLICADSLTGQYKIIASDGIKPMLVAGAHSRVAPAGD